ncbi:MAG: DNA polymerase I [Chloroflexota bacterium]|nr:MAG: DNA polymerase I [Chloroflexota bacterium]
MTDLLLLVDAHALVHRAYHAVKPLTTSRGEQINAVFGFASVLLKTLNDQKPRYVAVAFDRPGPTFRHEAYADYKANRARMADDLRPQFARVRELVDALGIPIVDVDGYEADDVLGTLTRQAREKGIDVLIVTGDTDAIQLVAPGVRVLTPSRGIADEVIYDQARAHERYGFEPIRIADYKALKGDPSDNVRGVPGIGEKTAQKLLIRYGSVEQLLMLPADLDAKTRAAIESNAEGLRLGLALTRIRQDAPVALDLAKGQFGHYDMERARSLLRELEFRTLIGRLPAADSAPATPSPQMGLFDTADIPQPTASARATPSIGVYRVATSEADLAELCADARVAGTVAIEVATDDGRSLFGTLIGIGISARAEFGWYVPLAGPGIDLAAAERAIAALRAPLEDSGVKKVGYDLKRSLHALATRAVTLRGIDTDVMIAAFVEDTSRRTLDLGELTWSLLELELPELIPAIGPGKGQVLGSTVDVTSIAEIVAARADVAGRLAVVLTQSLTARSLNEFFGTVEMPCVAAVAAMEAAGIAIDSSYLAILSAELTRRLESAQTRIWQYAGREFNVNSPLQLGQVLFDELKLPRGKRTRTGWSTDADTLEDLREAHPIIEALFEFRQVSKLKSTYVDALPALVSSTTGRIHTTYNQVGASTGRMSSSDPNLQNIPIRTDLGREVRRAFIAGSPGSILVAADYSQVELRILAHISRDSVLCEAFARGEDIHRLTAARILGVNMADVTADQRRLAKVVNYGIAYGLGDHGLATQAGIGRQEAGAFIRSYLDRHAGIAAYIEDIKRACASQGYVTTLMGRRVTIPEIGSVNRQVRSGAERRAINAPIQGSSADFMKVAIARVHRELTEHSLSTRVLLQVHDELVFEAPNDEIDAVSEIALRVMASVYPLDPPLEVEIKVGANWCDAE